MILNHPECDPNVMTKHGTALHLILHEENTLEFDKRCDIIKCLIDHPNVDVNLGDNKHPPLYRICTSNISNEVLPAFLSRKDLDINIKFGELEETVLTHFCKEGFYSEYVCRTLIQDPRCDINTETNEGTPLYVAIDQIKAIDQNRFSAALALAESKRIHINAGKGTQSPLCSAVMKIKNEGDIYDKIASKILDHPEVDPNSECEHLGVTCLAYLVDSNLGGTESAKKLASHLRFNIIAGNIAFKLIPKYNDLLKILIDNPAFGVNQRWSYKNETGAQRYLGDRQKETLTIYCAHYVQSLTDEYSEALKILCSAGADLNLCEVTESDSTLMKLLRSSNMNRNFKADLEILNLIKFLLENGSDPNRPPHTLAFAVNNCPVDVCKLIIENAANPDRCFRTDDKMIVNSEDNIDSLYKNLHIGSKETALHTAYRVGSPKK